MALFRLMAWVFLLIATIALVGDLTRAGTGNGWVLTSTLSHWKALSPQGLATFAGFIQKNIHPALWDPVMVRLLILPAWLLLGAIGVVLAVLGRKKRRVNIYAN
jgi:hypothetical protein